MENLSSLYSWAYDGFCKRCCAIAKQRLRFQVTAVGFAEERRIAVDVGSVSLQAGFGNMFV